MSISDPTDNIIALVETAGTCVVIACDQAPTDGMCATHRAEWESGTLTTDRFSRYDDPSVLGVNW